VAFRDRPSCEICHEPSNVRIVVIIFDGPSPADRYLCRVHAPPMPTSAPDESEITAAH
jgi:hypothetical protein